MEAASQAIEVLAKKLRPGLEAVLREVMQKSGEIATKNIKRQVKSLHAAGGFRVNVGDLAFDATNPNAVDWIRNHAAETIDGITEDTRQQIRDVVEEAFTEQYDVDELADAISDIIGDDSRADVIARTETMRASNEGQLEAWSQATDAGFLTGDEKKEWIVTPDDRLCPICSPLDGQVVGLNEDFDTSVGSVEGPPAHPNCRCTIGLSAG